MTILGHHTVHEAKQLAAAIEARVQDIDNAVASIQFLNFRDNAPSPFGGADSPDKWKSDWDAWRHQWTKASDLAFGEGVVSQLVTGLTLGATASVLTGTKEEDVTPDEDGYQNILTAIYSPADIDTVDPKNIDGLDRRLTAQIGEIQRTQTSQDAPDVDLNLIKQSDKILRPGGVPLKTIGLVFAGALGILGTAAIISSFEK